MSPRAGSIVSRRSHTVSVRLTEEVFKAGQVRAWEEHRTLSSLIEVALIQYIATKCPVPKLPGEKGAR